MEPITPTARAIAEEIKKRTAAPCYTLHIRTAGQQIRRVPLLGPVHDLSGGRVGRKAGAAGPDQF